MIEGSEPFRLQFGARRVGLTTVMALLFILGVVAALGPAGASARQGTDSRVSRAEVHAALRAEIRRVLSGNSSPPSLSRPHVETSHPFKQSWTAAPAVRRTAQGDGIDLLTPANGSAWQWAPGGFLHFSWYNAWYCPGCNGVVVMIVFDSTGNHAYEGTGVCPASSAPSCPTSVDVSLNPGTYTWGVGVALGTNPTHLSDIWAFQISGAAPAPGTTTTPPPPPPPPRTTTTATTATSATTTAPPATTTAPPATTTAPAPTPTPTTAPTPEPTPKCHVPNVKGMRLADAQIRLFKANCSLGKVTNVHSKVQKGRVIDQSPAPGGTFASDTPVRVMVSSGR